jgi:hypothetical protein
VELGEIAEVGRQVPVGGVDDARRAGCTGLDAQYFPGPEAEKSIVRNDTAEPADHRDTFAICQFRTRSKPEQGVSGETTERVSTEAQSRRT